MSGTSVPVPAQDVPTIISASAMLIPDLSLLLFTRTNFLKGIQIAVCHLLQYGMSLITTFVLKISFLPMEYNQYLIPHNFTQVHSGC